MSESLDSLKSYYIYIYVCKFMNLLIHIFIDITQNEYHRSLSKDINTIKLPLK